MQAETVNKITELDLFLLRDVQSLTTVALLQVHARSKCVVPFSRCRNVETREGLNNFTKVSQVETQEVKIGLLHPEPAPYYCSHPVLNL